MASNFFKVKNGLQIQPIAGAAPTEVGDVVYDSTANALEYYNTAARTVVNTDEAQTLTSKTLTGNIAVNLVSGAATVTLPTTTSSLATIALAETLTNKTLTSPILTTPSTEIITLDGQASAPSNPSAGNYKIYVSDTSLKLTVLDSAGVETSVGGGSGLKNYILAPDAEAGTTGWATYADAAGTRPVDGTGGAPTVTWASSSTTPLAGLKDFNFVKDAANRQGEGVGYAFTIDRADQGKPLQMEADMELISGTFVGSVAPATDSDLIWYIYDVTNAVLIEPQGRLIEPMVTGQYYRYRGTFQSSINSTSYRLILHCASTSASAYTLAFDSFRVGPQVISNGAVVTDEQSYTPTISAGFGTTSNTAFIYNRKGDSLIVRGSFTSGTTAASLGTLTFPIGAVIDSTKIGLANTSGNPGVEVGLWTNNGSNQRGSIVTATGTSTILIYFGAAAGGGSHLTPTNMNAHMTGGGVVSVEFKIPIAGWSSNVQMSNDSDTRVVAARASGDPASATTGNIIVFPTSDYDTHGGYVVGTGRYTVPSSGFYRVHGWILSATNGGQIAINVNAAQVIIAGQTDPNGECAYSGTVKVNAGDLIDIRALGATIDAASGSTLHFEMMSGPSQIAASESINARYYASATSISGTPAIISWTTKDFDSHNGMSAGIYTVPSAGKYQVNSALALSGTFILNNTCVIEILKNGTAVSNFTQYAGGAITQDSVEIADIVKCNAGDTLRIEVSSAGTTPAIVSSNTRNYVSISRVGN